MPLGDDRDEPGPGGEAAEPLPGVHRGREVCRGLLTQALCELGAAEPASAEAASPRRRPREVWLVDRHFADWPLDEPAVLDSLSAWLRPGGRCLNLVGLDFDGTARALPRFARWRRDWSHRIEVSRPANVLMPVSLRGMVSSEGALQWLDAPDWRLRSINNPLQLRAIQEQLADFLQRCEPGWPVTTLGL